MPQAVFKLRRRDVGWILFKHYLSWCDATSRLQTLLTRCRPDIIQIYKPSWWDTTSWIAFKLCWCETGRTENRVLNLCRHMLAETFTRQWLAVDAMLAFLNVS